MTRSGRRALTRRNTRRIPNIFEAAPIMTVMMGAASKIFGILRVFRLVRALRPLRVINRAPGLKLVVQGRFTIVINSPDTLRNDREFKNKILTI